MKTRTALRRPSFAASITLALCGPLWIAPQVALASPMAIYNSSNQSLGDGSAVLGLEGADSAKAAALTTALRSELAKRGQTESQDMTLAELKLTMGCEDGDLACISEGGKSLGVGELIYGKISGSGGEYTLTLTVLDVGKARVASGLTTTVDDAALSPAQIGATATDLVNRLLGPADGNTTPVPVATGGDGDGDTAETGDGDVDGTESGDGDGDTTEKPKKSGGLVWGMEKPPAKWKVIGLGVSGGMMLASLGTATVTTLMIRTPEGKIYKDLIAAAENSLEDSNARNDIAPDADGDLCTLARAEPADQPGKVTNADMTAVCNRADRTSTIATASWIGTGVFAASTAVFTVLLFTHKADESEASARVRRKMQKHQVSLGYTPRREGGFMFGGGWRF